MVREPGSDAYRRTFSGSADTYQFLKELADCDREKFIALHLDNKHGLICVDVVSVGSLTTSIVHPREVFKIALVVNAAAVIFVHNHPSGDPTPGKDDLNITTRLREAGDLLGIRVLDHIVIGRDRYVSFVDDGYW
jgi:DNA repair protein RadC